MADIAEQLGISKAAVSYALNDQPGVAADTRDRVLALARELGWHASSSARALSGAQTSVVGLVLSRPTDLLTVETFFIRFLAGLEQVLSERGFSLLLRVIGDHPEDEISTYERWWGERRIDGVILMDERVHDPRVSALAELGLPGVLCGGPMPGAELPCVWTDQAGDAAVAVQHLAALGHRRIGHVCGPPVFAHERARRRGVRRAGRARGVEVTTVEAPYTGPEAGKVTRRMLASESRPTALIFGSDTMAIAGLSAATELGLRVPEDLSAVSWDDSILTTLIQPAVTALSRDTPGYGGLAAAVLIDLIEGRNRGLVRAPLSTLQVRGSTARPS
ncbi:LacI family DNA-binding transcriptional regulator [Leekyejoonella antrihumi]|nr:LacI family DNA-binding transcriptional regulator [Leekyejoonella antrihumi]